MRRLEGKVALISGTAGGQGAAAARLFAAEGATVVGCDLDSQRASAVGEEIVGAGGAMTVDAPVGLADPGAATAWVDGAVARAGGIDILYNNASTPRVGPYEDDMGGLALYAPQRARPHLHRHARGMASPGGARRRRDHQHRIGLGAPRGDVHRTGRARRGQGRGAGDHASLGCFRREARHPGELDQPRADRRPADRAVPGSSGHPVHEMLRTHPLGRLGKPDDVARVALFLASDDAAYLNAVEIVVDGGQSLIS
jgi:NAD(P)-dependent dehydrogenase (short-subunit alcohol dehydrogenase family)